MKCSDTDPLLSAYIDDELSPSDTQAVAAHLDECSACRQQLAELRAVDGKISSLQPPADLAANIVAATANADTAATDRTSESLGTRYAWGMILAIAASVALIVFMKPAERALELAHPTVGKLVRATGEVEIYEMGSQFWKTLDESAVIREGARIRTGKNVQCEVETTERTLIRCDQQTEWVIYQADLIRIDRGQLWCRPGEGGSLQVELSPTWDESSEETYSLLGPTSSEFQLTVDDTQATFSLLAKQNVEADEDVQADESVPLQFGQDSYSVAVGETVAIHDGGRVERNSHIAAVSKAWQLPLLAVSKEQEWSGELSSILQPLLAGIGRTKARHMEELPIRALGPPGAIPLLTYAAGDDSRDEPDLRYTAVTLAAPIADRSAIGLLEKLASDDDPRVAQVCKDALGRLGDSP